jgi:hypothetical protein
MQLATVAVMRIDFLKASLSSNAEQNANRTIAHTSAAFYRSGQYLPFLAWFGARTRAAGDAFNGSLLPEMSPQNP